MLSLNQQGLTLKMPVAIKHEWRKGERALYLPRARPELIRVPEFRFITIRGEGSPADNAFTGKVAALFALAYTIKMNLKKMPGQPDGYTDYTVYPLEGVWDINDEAKARYAGTIDKKDFVYHLMIRQPDFIDAEFFREMLVVAREKKGIEQLDQLSFESISEGQCVQMLHAGRFEDEPESFEKMEAFTKDNGLIRCSKVHREIYLSDFRRVEPDKLKTVLRFQVAAQ